MCEKNQVQIIGRSATKERLISEAQAGLVQRERSTVLCDTCTPAHYCFSSSVT